MSNKLLGYPCTLAVDATPGSYTTIAAVLDVDFPSVQTDAQDFASRDSSSKREYTGGLRDGGELTFDVLYDPDDATHDTSAGLVAIAGREMPPVEQVGQPAGELGVDHLGLTEGQLG